MQIQKYRVFTTRFRYEHSIWLGWQDSNLRMTESKTVALPLGYIPVTGIHYSLIQNKSQPPQAIFPKKSPYGYLYFPPFRENYASRAEITPRTGTAQGGNGRYPQNLRSSLRYCTASMIWSPVITSHPSRSASVRATFITRS